MATPPVDPILAWAAVVGPVLVGLVASLVAWMKRNDPLPMLPPPIPAPITAPATSTDPAVLALQAANANMLEIINRHTQNADEHVALYARENGDLRKQNGELLERIAELQRQLMKCENNSSMLTTKVEVLQNRLDERERRG